MLGRLQKQAQLLFSNSKADHLKMASSGPNIDFYTFPTPNGLKISIALEELGLVLP